MWAYMTTPAPASPHPPVRCAVTVFKDKATQIKGFMSPERSSTGSQRPITVTHNPLGGAGRCCISWPATTTHLHHQLWVLSHLEPLNPETPSAPHASDAPDIPDAPDSTWNGTTGFRLSQTARRSTPEKTRAVSLRAKLKLLHPLRENWVMINMISYWSQYFTVQQRLKTQQINVSGGGGGGRWK